MSRLFRDPTTGRMLTVPTRAQLRYQENVKALHALGVVDLCGVHCDCCGAHLIDLNKIRVSSEGQVPGPECSKLGHPIPCKRRSAA